MSRIDRKSRDASNYRRKEEYWFHTISLFTPSSLPRINSYSDDIIVKGPKIATVSYDWLDCVEPCLVSSSPMEQCIQHCKQLVKRGDYNDYVCTLFLPLKLQRLKWALSAFNIETGRIKLASKTPEIAIARLQFWKDAISSVLFALSVLIVEIPIGSSCCCGTRPIGPVYHGFNVSAA